jgi:Neuraminidase (sialidase)
MRTSADNGATWSKPRLIIPDHGRRHQVIESVFSTREGYLVLPCDANPGGNGGTALHISRDRGATWTDPGGTIAGIHAAVTQLSDARLLAFGRGDTINNKMPLSISSDMGKTWTYSPSIFPPIGGGQRLVLLRLKQGPLFLASFANKPITITDASGKERAVTGLFAAISYDDGKTWPKIRPVTADTPPHQAQTTNGRAFTMSINTAEPRGYLSVCQGANALIHLTSSWNHYVFNLKWLQTPPPAETSQN